MGPSPPEKAAVEKLRTRARIRAFQEADARIRTADPFITSEVLYQLSYVGGRALV